MRPPTDERPAWLSAGRIPSLDGLRAVAVLLVVLAHAHQTAGFPDLPLLHAVAARGGVGVDVFFVLSGFLITTLMLRERRGSGGIDVKQFYLRRVLRIVPAYLVLLAVLALLTPAGYVHLARRDWALALTYTVNFVHRPAWEIGHAWSLSIEEHFYLLWPFLMAASPRIGRASAVACLALCFAVRWVVLLAFPRYTPMAELWTFTRMDTIAVGCLLAFAAWDVRGRQLLDRACGSGWRVAAVALALAGAVALAPFAKFHVGLAYTTNALCIALLAWAAVRHADSRVGRVLNHWTLRAIGVGSYSLYLWQQLFLQRDSALFICRFPQNMLFAALAAWASYRWVEKPFLSLKQAVARPRKGGVDRPVPTAAAGVFALRPVEAREVANA